MTVDTAKATAYAVLIQRTLDVAKVAAYGIVYTPPLTAVPLVATEPLTSGTDSQVAVPLILTEPLTDGVSVVACPLIVIEVIGSIPQEGDLATELFPIASPIRAPLSSIGLPGLAWSVHKKPMFVTDVNPAVNLKELRTSRTQYPVYQFELTFEFLDDRSNGTELQQMMGFFMNLRGRWGAFLFQDVTDYSLDAAVLATADGGQTDFTIFKYLGVFSDPIGQYDQQALLTFASSAVDTTTETVAFPGHGLVTGYGPVMVTNPSAVPTGLTASQPYWFIAVDANHFAFATSKANALAGTKVNLTAQGSGTNTLSNTVAFFDNGTLVNFSAYTLTSPNRVIFSSAPLVGHALTVSCKYFFVCRFEEDQLDFEEFMADLWTLQECNFRSILG